METIIRSFEIHKFLVRAHFGDGFVIKNDYLVAIFYRAESMSDNERRPADEHFLDTVLN